MQLIEKYFRMQHYDAAISKGLKMQKPINDQCFQRWVQDRFALSAAAVLMSANRLPDTENFPFVLSDIILTTCWYYNLGKRYLTFLWTFLHLACPL